MKIKTADYNYMELKIKAVLENHPNAYQGYKDAGLSDKRYRWDLVRYAGLMPYICDVLYKYLNDTHIDTALKNITNTK